MLNVATVLVGTAVSLVLLGLTVGFSPTLIALQVAVLVRDGETSDDDDAVRAPNMSRGGLVVAGGVATGALLLTLLLQVANPDAWGRLFEGKIRALLVERAFDGVAGALFVIGGVWMLRHRHSEPGDESKHLRKATRMLDHPRELFGFAAVNTVVSISGAASAYLVIRLAHEHSTAGISVVAVLAVYAGFAAAAAAPYLLMWWGTGRFPRLAGPLERLGAWVRSRSWRTIGGWLLVAFGILLMVGAATRYFGLA